MTIGSRFRFLAPFTRPESISEHEQNWAKLDERFNALPIDVPMFAVAGYRDTTVPSLTLTSLKLPIYTYGSIDFDIPIGSLSTTITCRAPGWYLVTWEILTVANGESGYRQTQCVFTDVPTDYATCYGSSLNFPGTQASAHPGSVLVPLKAGSTLKLQASTESPSAQSFRVPRFAAHWVRPLDENFPS